MLLEAKLGVRMQVSAPFCHLVMKQIDEVWDLHDEHIHGVHKFESTLRRARK
jgi:hypothetical protein